MTALNWHRHLYIGCDISVADEYFQKKQEFSASIA
jgi:hypothetical protein